MDVEAFLKTIYLGDRACKGLVIDTWNKRLKLHVDSISRVRGLQWNYYNAEDIEDGFIVFDGVREFRLDPPGPLPNDYISGIEVKPVALSLQPPLYEFRISVSSINEHAASLEVEVRVTAADCYLEDPAKPGQQIR